MNNFLQVMNEINNRYRFNVDTSHMLIGSKAHGLLKAEINRMNGDKGLPSIDEKQTPNHVITFMGIPMRPCPELPDRSYVVIGSNNQVIGYGNL